VTAASASAVSGLHLAGSNRFRRTVPSLAALAYPSLIWCGQAVGPIFLAIAVGIPLVGVFIAHALDHRLYPRSRWIAFAVGGTPALYSLLGGWLDFQRVVALNGLQVWTCIWLAFAGIAFWERPSHSPTVSPQLLRQRRLALAHGISAMVIACFAAAHVLNHLGGLWGGEQHTAIMHALRLVYRNPIVETVLLASITFQLISGVRLLVRKLPHTAHWIDSLQAAAAGYLVVFFLSHLSAVLKARYLRHVDTNWSWAADGLLTDPWTVRLAPYYFLAVIAFGVHGGAGARRVMLNHGRAVQLADRTFCVVAAGAAALSGSIIVGLIRG